MSYLNHGTKKVPVHVLATNASLGMDIDIDRMRKSASTLSNAKIEIFMNSLAKAFLDAGEAKWWDAQVAAMASEVLTGFDRTGAGVCNGWARGKRTRVSLLWRSKLTTVDEKEPYGS